jgi:hypothetical protein
MSAITSHLMRRGTEAAMSSFQVPSDKKTSQPNGGLVALFFITVVVISLIFWSVSAYVPVPVP